MIFSVHAALSVQQYCNHAQIAIFDIPNTYVEPQPTVESVVGGCGGNTDLAGPVLWPTGPVCVARAVHLCVRLTFKLLVWFEPRVWGHEGCSLLSVLSATGFSCTVGIFPALMLLSWCEGAWLSKEQSQSQDHLQFKGLETWLSQHHRIIFHLKWRWILAWVLNSTSASSKGNHT